MTGVVVVGSANLDVVLAVRRIPRPGETVLASGLRRGPGGKGANQAVAAARAGAPTRLLAAIGDDDAGDLLRSALAEAGVDLGLVRSTRTPTGTAIITVDESGENAITVAPSANAELVLDAAATAAVADADVVLAQLEVPLGTVRAAAEAARYFVLNAAPAAPLDEAILRHVDLLVVNEHEAETLAGTSGEPAEVGKALLRRVPGVVITLGADGVLVVTRGSAPEHVRGAAVETVDTTAAGDTFCGVLAASLAAGSALPDAVRRGNAAASLTVQAAGAITSIPAASDIDARYADLYR